MEIAETPIAAVAQVATAVRVGPVDQVATRKKKVLPRSGILTVLTAPSDRIVPEAFPKKRVTENESARIVQAASRRKRVMERSLVQTAPVVAAPPKQEARAEDAQVLA